MPVFLLVFEFLGTTELVVIAAVALLIFGPRKLPEIGRTIGRSLAEFKRASEDFKRTWEYEVEMERSDRETRVEQSDPVVALPEGDAPTVPPDTDDDGGVAHAATEEHTVARGATDDAASPVADDDASPASSHDAASEQPAEESPAAGDKAGDKKDWL